jgi:topoisomerase IA-like protein
MAKLTAPNGVVVSVADEKVEALLARGFSRASSTPSAPAKKAAAKKADARKTPAKKAAAKKAPAKKATPSSTTSND